IIWPSGSSVLGVTTSATGLNVRSVFRDFGEGSPVALNISSSGTRVTRFCREERNAVVPVFSGRGGFLGTTLVLPTMVGWARLFAIHSALVVSIYLSNLLHSRLILP